VADIAETTARLERLRSAGPDPTRKPARSLSGGATAKASDPGRRPTLHLKNPPSLSAPAPAAARWKCKPCGTLFQVDESLAATEVVRCPACNARLGRAGQFRVETGDTPGVRARLVQQ